MFSCFHGRMSAIDALEFRVEVWDPSGSRVEELVALCSNSLVAKGAYEAALRLRPANIVLSHRTRIIARARGKPNC
jgi:hypothetical protein